jgi:uncharacterized cupredoxin-like copper-binding protein
MKSVPTVLASLLLALPLAAAAHGDSHPKKADASISADKHPWGQQGDPKQAARTIKVSMADTMRFTPDRFEIRRGDTVTFEIANRGRLMHEFVIGTEAELVRHADLMKRFPDMEHDAPYMAHVKPDARQRITWRFSEPGTFLAGCLIAGHWEAGMKATIVVKE